MSPPPLLPRLIVCGLVGVLAGLLAGWLSSRVWVGVPIGIVLFFVSFPFTAGSAPEPDPRGPRLPTAMAGNVAVFFDFRSLGYATLAIETRERLLIAGFRSGENGAVYGLECDVLQDGRIVASRTCVGPPVETEIAAPLTELRPTASAAAFKPIEWLGEIPRPCTLRFRWDPGRLATKPEHWHPGRIELGDVTP